MLDDAGFKKAFKTGVKAHTVTVEVANKLHPHRFEVLPKRWIVERIWAWMTNNRRLQIDYERDPLVTQGFVWAAHTRLLLRRLTEQVYDQRAGNNFATTSKGTLPHQGGSVGQAQPGLVPRRFGIIHLLHTISPGRRRCVRFVSGRDPCSSPTSRRAVGVRRQSPARSLGHRQTLSPQRPWTIDAGVLGVPAG